MLKVCKRWRSTKEKKQMHIKHAKAQICILDETVEVFFSIIFFQLHLKVFTVDYSKEKINSDEGLRKFTFIAK